MSSYTITNPRLNPKRVFILQKSELENRFDPSWYVYLQSIQGFKHKKVAFKSLLLNNPQYGANEIGINRESNNEPRYIRITDINEFGELENVLGKTASTIEEKYFLEENDLLLARSGNTVGKSYLHKKKDYDCFFAGYMIRFKIDETKVLPKYIFAYTQTELYKKWVKAIQRTTGQPNINAEEYRSLEIPLPDKKIQEKVIETYFDFISHKQTNEAEAEKLLASIDDYLLGELGITLPKETYYLQEIDFRSIVSEPKEEYGNYRFIKEKFELNQQSKLVKQNRIFITNFSEVMGSRFDPNFNKKYFKEIFNSFSKSKYSFLKIKDVLENIKTGTTPNQKLEPYADDNGIVFLRNTNLKKYNIDLSDTKFIKTELAKELTYSVKDEVIMCIAGTVGLSAVNNIDKPFSINQINPDFASYWFNTQIFLELTKRACSVATIFYLNNDNLKLLPIPVPPLDKQKEIADYITNIRKQAQALKDKTKDLLKKASEEIEMILLN